MGSGVSIRKRGTENKQKGTQQYDLKVEATPACNPDTSEQQETYTNDLGTDDLQILESIGEGRTAQVFRAMRGGRQVAVKRMACATEKDRESLRRELDVLLKVKHPNLVHLLGFRCQQRVGCKTSEDLQTVFAPHFLTHSYLSDYPCDVILDYCSGGSLFELLHNSRCIFMTWAQKNKIAIDIVLGMQYLHGRDPPIIHRDLKSLNVLLVHPISSVCVVPFAKVADFGLARTKQCSSRMTQAAGSGNWMAPEVFSTNSYDYKVDVYSFALVLFELLKQEIPFEKFNAARLGLAVVQGARPSTCGIAPDCPEILTSVMVSCWAAAPDARPEFSEVHHQLSTLQIQLKRK